MVSILFVCLFQWMPIYKILIFSKTDSFSVLIFYTIEHKTRYSLIFETRLYDSLNFGTLNSIPHRKGDQIDSPWLIIVCQLSEDAQNILIVHELILSLLERPWLGLCCNFFLKIFILILSDIFRCKAQPWASLVTSFVSQHVISKHLEFFWISFCSLRFVMVCQRTLGFLKVSQSSFMFLRLPQGFLGFFRIPQSF